MVARAMSEQQQPEPRAWFSDVDARLQRLEREHGELVRAIGRLRDALETMRHDLAERSRNARRRLV
jgi:hypothetical protein